MLHKQAISVALLNGLMRLMKVKELNDFRLVGGTRWALQSGRSQAFNNTFLYLSMDIKIKRL